MENVRIIPRLDIKGKNVVKGVHTEGLRVVGTPKELVERYHDADEIIYLDIVASLYQRKINLKLLCEVSKKIFIPLTVGGGIQTLADIQKVLDSGADKVAINTYAVRNPAFLKKAVMQFGSQCIMLFVEAKKVGNAWEAYTDGGRERTRIDAICWIKRVITYGVGEILITSIDHDGTRLGFELPLIKEIAALPVPIIVHGGAGTPDDVREVIRAGADAVALSSIFHYKDISIRELKKLL